MKEPKAPVGTPATAGSPSVTPVSLLERLRAKDGVAWQRAIQLYGPLVTFWCRRSGLHAQDAEDVSQEVFAAAAAGIGGFHHDRPGDTFRGWLQGITRNQVLFYLRRRHNQPQAEGGSNAWQNLQEVSDPLGPADDEERAVIDQIYLQALEQVRGQFEPATWQAFWRTAVDGRTPAELATELGMTSAAIRQAKSRVLRRLKQELGELLE
jgi:RNA polymerase sigma-70 factor (ECF subfamily)